MSTIVAYQGNNAFIGGVDMTEGQLNACMREGVPVQLVKARSVKEFSMMNPATGSINLKTFLGPIHLAQGPISISVVLGGWYWAAEAFGVKELNDLLREAERAETTNRAQRSGIHMPGPGVRQ